jgi:hypothetical protein
MPGSHLRPRRVPSAPSCGHANGRARRILFSSFDFAHQRQHWFAEVFVLLLEVQEAAEDFAHMSRLSDVDFPVCCTAVRNPSTPGR